MRNHLSGVHKELWAAMERQRVEATAAREEKVRSFQPTLFDVTSRRGPEKWAKARRLCAIASAVDYRPLSTWSTATMRLIFSELTGGKLKGVGRTTTLKYVRTVENEEIRPSIRKAIASASKISVTTDGWTSVTTESYLAVTAHFVDQNCEMRHLCLTVEALPGMYVETYVEPRRCWRLLRAQRRSDVKRVSGAVQSDV